MMLKNLLNNNLMNGVISFIINQIYSMLGSCFSKMKGKKEHCQKKHSHSFLALRYVSSLLERDRVSPEMS